MPAVILSAKITGSELNLVKQEYGEYVKIVVDIQKNLLAAGGEWHADAEKLLLEQGSQQKNLWGAGLDLVSGQIDYVSLINTRLDLCFTSSMSNLPPLQTIQKHKQVKSETLKI